MMNKHIIYNLYKSTLFNKICEILINVTAKAIPTHLAFCFHDPSSRPFDGSEMVLMVRHYFVCLAVSLGIGIIIQKLFSIPDI